MKSKLLLVAALIFSSLLCGQFYGYRGKKLEIGIQYEASMLTPIYHGTKLETTSKQKTGLRVPSNWGFQSNLAVSQRFGVGFSVWQGGVFVGYNTPFYKAGYSYREELCQCDKKTFFQNNYTLKSNYVGGVLRVYNSSDVAPTSDYWEIGIGKLSLRHQSDEEYSIYLSENHYYSSYDSYLFTEETIFNSEFENDEIELRQIEVPEIKPIYFLSISWNKRFLIPKVNNCFFDIGFSTMWNLEKVRENGESRGYHPYYKNGEYTISSIEDFESLVFSNSHIWSMKKNFFKLNFKINGLLF